MALTEREKVAHLLRRFGLGASESEVAFYSQSGYEGAVDALLNWEQIPELVEISADALRNDKGQLNPRGCVAWFGANIMTTRRPLLAKMTVFWHNHFATSLDKVTNANFMVQHVETLKTHATGNFRTLLEAISKDPAMLWWLDNRENIKGRANENFAREVMELFTLGIGNYSERDIQEAARAFTGWQYKAVGKNSERRGFAEYVFRPNLHDDSEKTIFGKTDRFSGEQVLSLLCDNPRTAQFLTEKLWVWFVSPTPDAAAIKKYAKVLYDANYEIKPWLRAVMLGPEFQNDRTPHTLVKNPLEFCISTARALGIGEVAAAKFSEVGENPDGKRRQAGLLGGVTTVMKNQGMELLYPPDVAGWKIGTNWITTATMLERVAWAPKLFSTANRIKDVSRNPVYDLLSEDPTPQGIATKLCSLFDARVPGDKFDRLTQAATKLSGGKLTERNALNVAVGVTRLIFGMPEYQVG